MTRPTAVGGSMSSCRQPTRCWWAGLIGVLLLAACVPIPIVHTERAFETGRVEVRLPAELVASSSEVLLLAQTVSLGAGGYFFGRRLDEQFVPGESLPEYLRQLATSSDVEVFLFGCGYLSCEVFPAWKKYSTLERLCIVAPDGRTVTLFGTATPHPLMENSIFERRRDALVHALGQDTEAPFAAVDGPCGVAGQVSWSAQRRKRVVDFLAAIPGRQPSDDNEPLGRVLAKARTAVRETGGIVDGGILLAVTTVHGERVAEAPLYFSDADFRALYGTLGAQEPKRILPFLRSSASGASAPEHVALSLLAAVSSGGDLLWWTSEQRSWRDAGQTPYDAEWASMKAALVESFAGAEDELVSAFLDRAAVRVRAVDEELRRARDSAMDEKAASYLLLGAGASQGAVVLVPVFLEPRSFPVDPGWAGEWIRQLLGFPDQASVDYACLISADGRLVEFEQAGRGSSAQKLKEARSPRINDAWRRNALGAVLQDGNFDGAFVCGLQHARGWSDELRGKVAAFLTRVDASATGVERLPP